MKHEIIYKGKPNIKNMPKAEFNVFCKSILDIIIEEIKDEKMKKTKESDNKKDVATQKNKAPDSSDACI